MAEEVGDNDVAIGDGEVSVEDGDVSVADSDASDRDERLNVEVRLQVYEQRLAALYEELQQRNSHVDGLQQTIQELSKSHEEDIRRERHEQERLFDVGQEHVEAAQRESEILKARVERLETELAASHHQLEAERREFRARVSENSEAVEELLRDLEALQAATEAMEVDAQRATICFLGEVIAEITRSFWSADPERLVRYTLHRVLRTNTESLTPSTLRSIATTIARETQCLHDIGWPRDLPLPEDH